MFSLLPSRWFKLVVISNLSAHPNSCQGTQTCKNCHFYGAFQCNRTHSPHQSLCSTSVTRIAFCSVEREPAKPTVAL